MKILDIRWLYIRLNLTKISLYLIIPHFWHKVRFLSVILLELMILNIFSKILSTTYFLTTGLWSTTQCDVYYFFRSSKLRGTLTLKNGPSKICGRQPLKNCTCYILEYFAPDIFEDLRHWGDFCYYYPPLAFHIFPWHVKSNHL